MKFYKKIKFNCNLKERMLYSNICFRGFVIAKKAKVFYKDCLICLADIFMRTAASVTA